MHHFKVTSDPSGHADGMVIELDGKKLGFVTHFSIKGDVTQPFPLVFIEMHAAVDVDAQVPNERITVSEPCNDGS